MDLEHAKWEVRYGINESSLFYMVDLHQARHKEEERNYVRQGRIGCMSLLWHYVFSPPSLRSIFSSLFKIILFSNN